MSVPAVSSNEAVGTPTAAQLAALNATTRATGQSTLGENDFLKLLTVQLQNQDPLQPMSDTEFISQMATFSSLSQMQTLNSNFTDFSQTQGATSAAGLIGQTVTVDDTKAGTVTGKVTGVTVSDGTTEVTINGASYAVSEITGIQAAADAANTSSSTN